MPTLRRKVPGGKLLVLKCEAAGGRLRRVRLQGDFFLHPEGKLPLLERAMEGRPVAALGEALDRVVSAEGLRLVGFTAVDLVALAEAALGAAR